MISSLAYVSGFLKTVLKGSRLPSKVDNINIKTNISIFVLFCFFTPLSYLPFLALLSVLFFDAYSDFKAFWSCEIKVHMALLVRNTDMVFINAVTYVSYGKTCESTYDLERCSFHSILSSCHTCKR